MSEVRLLAPPYGREEWPTDRPPPLGAIALCAADSRQVIESELRPFLAQAPWCIPGLIVSAETASTDVLTAIHEMPGQPVFVPNPLDRMLLPSLAIAAVRRRSRPTGARLAEYVARRTGRPSLGPTLIRLLAAAAEDSGSDVPARTLRDRLHRVGQLTPRCWRTIGTLSRIAAGVVDEGVEALAWQAGVGARSLRAWTRRLLGVSLGEFRERAGWEWVLEAALRQATLLEWPGNRESPTSDPAALPSAIDVPAGSEANADADR